MTDIARLYPCFRYHDAEAALAWLTDVAGLTLLTRHDGPDGRPNHAELALGGSILMMGAVRDDAFGALCGTPQPGPVGQGGKCLYLAVADAAAVYARVQASGVAILKPLTATSYGSTEFLCADPEGNLFSFGTYAPVPPG